jgi:thiol-disulfide isomerase/thioredoxin
MIPPEFWTYLSGGILIVFGLVLVFPGLWERLPGLSRLSGTSNMWVGSGYQKKSFAGDALIGAALGPVFSTCSPTYFVILASVLPASFLLGTLYLVAYVLGLSLILLLIAILGQRFADKLAWVADPNGWFKRILGAVFIVLGVLIATGLEKKIEVAILESGFFDVTRLEQKLLDWESMPSLPGGTRYTEIVDPSGFVNTESVTIGEHIGKKVILVDFMTYSCINCQRTFPYLVAWYEKYKDQGLQIVGIHTPEFAFEKDIDNVRSAMKQFGIEYPVVLDNEYRTWRAYGNQYWPRKYLIDIHGKVVYDHIGEGAYDATETKIRELLEERSRLMGEGNMEDGELVADSMPAKQNFARSPETYFGAWRNQLLANGRPGVQETTAFRVPAVLLPNKLYLGGTWSIRDQHSETVSDATVAYRYYAKNVYLVMESASPADVEVWQDGILVKRIMVKESVLYTIVDDALPGEHVLELKFKNSGVRLFAFTFG